MDNKFDRELDRLRRADRAPRAADSDQLGSLQTEIDGAQYSKEAHVECERANDDLKVRVKGQPIALWRVEGSLLTLYRPGSSSVETHATDPGQAAIFTARLVAAAGQA